MSSRHEQLSSRQFEQFGKVLNINVVMAGRLSDHLRRENQRSPGRKPSQTSLGAACFMLGLDYYTYKLQASLMPIARSTGLDTRAIETAINSPASWIVTMQAGGINGAPH